MSLSDGIYGTGWHLWGLMASMGPDGIYGI
jgi:hypothetical protein